MRAAVTKIDGATGATEIYVTKLQASGPITDVFESRGAEHLRTTFGDITLSETVSKAAAQASAEEDERISLLATAEANKEARKLLKPTPEELANPELYQFAATLAASQDANARNIKVVLVPGANPLTAAAVAAASQIGDKA